MMGNEKSIYPGPDNENPSANAGSSEKLKDTPKEICYNLSRMMADIAVKGNKEFGGNAILNNDASVNMVQWETGNGGPHSRADRKRDRKVVNEHLLLYSGLSKMEEGPKRDAAVAAWLEKRGLSMTVLMERSIAAACNKIVGGKFIIVLPAIYDDIVNGVDNMMVNKETGDVICAFDEIREYEGLHRGEAGHEEGTLRKVHSDEFAELTRREKKEEKIIRKAERGGAKIRYGFGKEGGKLVKKEITGVPLFYVSLAESETKRLLNGMDYVSDQPSAVELEVFDKLILSFEKQAADIGKASINSDVRRNLANFEKSLAVMKELRKRF
ncbi:MAG: hypothetical protein PHE24_03675 [Patescibacteria group bacterium]|nr:hypothetical protein [Patescibacteria group bacterium]